MEEEGVLFKSRTVSLRQRHLLSIQVKNVSFPSFRRDATPLGSVKTTTVPRRSQSRGGSPAPPLAAGGSQVVDSLAQVRHEVEHGGGQTLVDEVARQVALRHTHTTFTCETTNLPLLTRTNIKPRR